MSDEKITQLTAITTLTNDDLIPVVNDPAGTPVTNSITVGSVKTVLTPVDGWIPVTDTWTYASASTITTPADGTTVYHKGIKIRFKQGGGYKYYIGKTIAATLLTVAINSDYTVANAAITDISYSYADNPLGFPHHFTFVSTVAGFSTAPTVISMSYSMSGGKLFFEASTNDGTGNADTFTLTVPFPARVLCTGVSSMVRDNAAYLGPGYWQIAAAASVLAFYKPTFGAWTSAAGKGVYASGFYEI